MEKKTKLQLMTAAGISSAGQQAITVNLKSH